MRTFDYVIAGAGAAGCVLANRLSEDPRVTVALLEAGPDHRHPFITMPKGIGVMLDNARYTWPFPTEPEAGNGQAAEKWTRGKVVGGSSSLNGLMYVRGHRPDFDGLARRTSADWGWDRVAAAYRAIESHELGPGEARGGSGPLRVTLPTERTRLTEAMIAAGEAMGLARVEDVNDVEGRERIGYSAITIERGRRVSAATAFLDPVRSRPNLTLVTKAVVDRVRLDGRRATGVEIVRGAEREVIAAAREVIVSSGTLSSPGILQRSGIGPAPVLRPLGIDVVADLPVGRSLAEHRAILLQWKLREPLSQNRDFAGLRLLAITARYFLRRTGPMAAAADEVGAWLKTRPELDRPDIQFLVAPFSFDLPSGRKKLETFPGMHICAYVLRPTSRGELAIHSRDPLAMPTIRPNFRSTAEDRRAMIDLVAVARRYVAQAPLAALIETETYPGSAATSDEAILEGYDRYGTCGYHAIGTCRMGNDAASVLDPELRVRGVERLRVVDNSIFPEIPSGNTVAPVMAAAWIAADVIRRGAPG